jgi:hypothetical protein
VAKAYPKMPDTVPTLLVINDDLMVSFTDWSAAVTDIGLYTPKSSGYTSGYLSEDGPFVDGRCERLGAVGVFNVRLAAAGIEYRFRLFDNPHALPSVLLPPEIGAAYPRHRDAPPPERPDGELWFKKFLRDPEWLKNPGEKARQEARKVIEELKARRLDRTSD